MAGMGVMTAGPSTISGVSGGVEEDVMTGVGTGILVGTGETACTANATGSGSTTLGVKTIGVVVLLDPNLNMVSKQIGMM